MATLQVAQNSVEIQMITLPPNKLEDKVKY